MFDQIYVGHKRNSTKKLSNKGNKKHPLIVIGPIKAKQQQKFSKFVIIIFRTKENVSMLFDIFNHI